MLDTVQGQDEGVRFLRRVVSGHITSPLLLVGKDGVGKRFSVLEAAKEAFSKGDPTDTFHSNHIDAETHPDLTVIRPDGSGIKIDAIRELTSMVSQYPSYAAARYVVIDGADQMNLAASNAFLKTLEEPPSTVRFFLLAESADDVLPTIRSRCGLVRYRALPEAFILARIQPSVPDPLKALVVCRLAEGSVGRANKYSQGRLRLRDQVLELLKPAFQADLASTFQTIDGLKEDLGLGLRFLEHILHDILMVNVSTDRMTNVDKVDEIRGIHQSLGPQRAYEMLLRLRTLQGYLDRGTAISLASHAKSVIVGVGN